MTVFGATDMQLLRKVFSDASKLQFKAANSRVITVLDVQEILFSFL